MAKVKEEKKSLLLKLCYLLMASLFALSTCFQFDDPDWYFWIPLYATATTVNMVSGLKLKVNESRISKFAKIPFFLGMFLFIKVSAEGILIGEEGFWSLNMRERTVREKLGSGLVIISMFMHLLEKSFRQVSAYGVPILAIAAYALSFIFFAFQHNDMRY